MYYKILMIQWVYQIYTTECTNQIIVDIEKGGFKKY